MMREVKMRTITVHGVDTNVGITDRKPCPDLELHCLRCGAKWFFSGVDVNEESYHHAVLCRLNAIWRRTG